MVKINGIEPLQPRVRVTALISIPLELKPVCGGGEVSTMGQMQGHCTGSYPLTCEKGGLFPLEICTCTYLCILLKDE